MKMKRYLVLTLLLLLAVASQAQQYGPKDHAADSCFVTLSCFPSQGGDAAGEGRYISGSRVTVYADPFNGFEFVEWREGTVSVSADPNYTFIITHDIHLTAYFSNGRHSITVDPGITHGTVTVTPSGLVETCQVVTITAVPATNYVLSNLWAYKKGDSSHTVPIQDNTFIMPEFDVMVSAVFAGLPPVITGQIAPQAICSGQTLTLTKPAASNVERDGWEICPDEYFQMAQAYTGQTLDASYNGWKLRYWASNDGGVSYSNVVGITVSVFEPELTGELYLCTMQSGTYTASHVGNATLTWTVSDQAATVTESGKTLKVKWATAGQQTVTLNAVNETTGCSAELKLGINVVSYVDSNDVQQIVAKKDNGKDYILIYPNPKEPYRYQWYKDGVAISGATGQYYYQQGGLDSGAYKVYLSLNADANGNLFGGAFTNEYVVTNPNISLSPNPVQSGEGLLVVNNSEEVAVSVYTIDGRLLHQQTINGTTTLDLNLAQGIYLIKLNDHQNEYIEKLIVK